MADKTRRHVVQLKYMTVNSRDIGKLKLYNAMYKELLDVCKQCGGKLDISYKGLTIVVGTTAKARRQIRSMYGHGVQVFRKGNTMELGGFRENEDY